MVPELVCLLGGRLGVPPNSKGRVPIFKDPENGDQVSVRVHLRGRCHGVQLSEQAQSVWEALN